MGACETRPEAYQDPFEEDDELAAERALARETDPEMYNKRAADLQRLRNRNANWDALEAQYPGGVPEVWRPQPNSSPPSPPHTDSDDRAPAAGESALDVDLARTAAVYRGGMTEQEALAYVMEESRRDEIQAETRWVACLSGSTRRCHSGGGWGCVSRGGGCHCAAWCWY